MAADDLSKPLTPDHPARNAADRWSWVNLVAAALVTIGLGVLAWIPLQSNPLGGQPYVVVSLQTNPDAGMTQPNDSIGPSEIRQAIAPEDKSQPDAPAEIAAPNVSAVQRGGDIAFNQNASPPDEAPANDDQPVIYRTDGNGLVRLSNAGDPRLIEQTRAGSLPKIGPEGQRASVVYARPSRINPANADEPKIAILVTGLGISASGTSEAIQRLPGEISLAFAPYGGDLQRWIGKARRAGHEVLLQVPMEPFDYPDN
ncbi:MAG: divergent polysaccharide deacetylase family protein, partial [Fimbriimonadaceae bacterium]|nr:divergent polysaccharide deacetylase family protein [Alphaproteobacteria bacterium]